MKISYNWLKEYIKIDKSPESVSELFTKSGSEVKAIEKSGGDSIMEIEITPNRSDCLSYIGMARELSALTGEAVEMPPLKADRRENAAAPAIKVDIKAADLCPLYTARLISGVKVAESPQWLKEKIKTMGLRPVNNVVDITNFVLFETGQPMHAFDYDKINGDAVIIRRALDGEKVVSIDNLERRLGKEMIVIVDAERPIAIGGVMGAANTEVTEDTKNILLESAYFNPVSVRRTSFKLSLISESSYRFERGVDPDMVPAASARAALLIKDLCGGEISPITKAGKIPKAPGEILLNIERLNRVLNLKLNAAALKKMFSSLGMKVSSLKKGVLKVAVPTFRQDIRYEHDLIEEAARIYGYENIKMTVPKLVPSPERRPMAWKAKEKAAEVLISLGLNEVITYGLISRGVLRGVFDESAQTISIKNPLSAEQEVMRPSIIPGILSVLNHNLNRGVKDLKIFEIGNVYERHAGKGRGEDTNICVAITGLFSRDWQRQKNDVTFFDLKGILEELAWKLGLEGLLVKERPVPFFANDASSEIYYDGKRVGTAGCLSSAAAAAFDIEQNVFIAELNFDAIVPFVNFDKRFRDIPKYPSVKRDISLVASSDISFNEITSIVRRAGGDLVEGLELFDKYTGRQIPSGSYGLSFRIEYRDRKRTLTAREADEIHSAIRKSLVEKLGITLR